MRSSKNSQSVRDYAWNTLGSAMSAASSFILLLVVTRVMGPYAGGVFSIAYALAQQFQTLGAFEMRPYQATDISEKYPFAVYFSSRILTCVLMFAAVILYASLTNGLGYETLLIVLVGSLRLFDALEDVFHGAFQQKGRLDIAGKAFFFRVLTTTLVFCIAVLVFQDLLAACLASMAFSTIAFLWLNLPPARKMLSLRSRIRPSMLLSLMKACFPLFIGAFLAAYLSNAPRFGIELFYSKDYQAYYSILFMPALGINLLNQFAFRPLLTTLARRWVDGNIKAYCRIITRSLEITFLAFLALSVVLYPFGTPLLGAIYGVDLSSFRPELMVLLFGGVLSAVSIVLYYVLVTMRKQGTVLVGYAVTSALVFGLANPLISSLGMMGAALLYTLSFGILSCLLGFFCLRYIARESRSFSGR